MKKALIWIVIGVLIGISFLLIGSRVSQNTSENEYCISCHIHMDADKNWKHSTHYETKSGVRTSCVECHLPPKGVEKMVTKMKMGVKDIWKYWTIDSAAFDWEAKSRLEEARGHVYESSCVACHENIFPLELSKEGEDAHLYYKMKKEEGMEDLHCINCHLNAGHYMEGYTHGSNSTFGKLSSEGKELFKEAATVLKFTDFTEFIPNTTVSFNMKAIEGGSFKMGSPKDEPYRSEDEGPVANVEISPFYMAEIETTWDEYMAFYSHTSLEGRTTDTEGTRGGDTDAISGATPPYGQPDQGWGMGQRPVLSISFHAAETYCRWLSKVTGKHYRLPTEAEWEYAARGGSDGPYFFEGNPKDFYRMGLFSKWRGNDTTNINRYVIYKENSRSKTHLPESVHPNPFGLKNMYGNVAEFCSDFYSSDIYSTYPSEGVKDPKGPDSGEERVVRGGSYLSNASLVRSAARSHTRSDEWLKTDPQMPKSIWWYSDCFYVGFRVVCEYDEITGNK